MAKYVNKWKNPGSKHSDEYSGLYTSWINLFHRVNNPEKYPTYSDVTVCERWFSYDNFFEDMADTWFKGASLDKDSIKPGNRVYCKEYCKWVNKSDNSRERINRCGNPNKIKTRSKKVYCIETGEIFQSVKEASELKGFGASIIASVCRGDRKSVNKYHFKYI